MADKEFISLHEGSGGKEMDDLISSFGIKNRGNWKNYNNDSATLELGGGKHLVFTTDSFIVSPIFFPDANIGHIAFCGTVNDLSMMGAKPLGLSLSFIIEEGFPKSELRIIIDTINTLSEKHNIPIVTGDTKVMDKGKIDKIAINTSGVGITDFTLDKKLTPGDDIILSGGIGEHAVALLSKRFDYKTSIISDSKPLINEISAIKNLIKQAKDITRGGIAAILNDIARKNNVGMLIKEDSISAKHEVRRVVEMLGINIYELASEGRFVCIAPKKDSQKVLLQLKKFNKDAAIIGEITKGDKVVLKTFLGQRILPPPIGRIVPRIC